jgi:hypothetical protein
VAIDRTLTDDDPAVGLRIIGAIWRWYQQRGRLREARAVIAELLARPLQGDVRIRIDGLAAEGGLAYWMEDFAASRRAYDERLALASETGDQALVADAHYDLGFLSGVAQDADGMRAHEARALELYEAAGRDDGALLARQALAVGAFLAADYQAASDLESENLEILRRSGSQIQVADSLILLAAARWRLGEPVAAWGWASEALRFFASVDNASGLARALAMAAIILVADGDAELGARVAGALQGLVREKGVMVAPVTVMHLPDPAGLAAERLGAERAAQLLAEGEAMAVADVVSEILGREKPRLR